MLPGQHAHRADASTPRAPRACRVCATQPLEVVLDLGDMPLVDRLQRAGEPPGERVPLALCRCPACGLLQTSHTPPRAEVFGDRYRYLSSCGDAVVRSAREHAQALTRDMALASRDLVLEIASNDGYQLAPFAERGIQTLGIEPTPLAARIARERGITTREAFFDEPLACTLRDEGLSPKLVIAKNVVAHVDDPVALLRGVADVLAPGGRLVIEAGYARDLIERAEFDTIYHEHQCYLTATALGDMLARAGLALTRAERIALHGGSVRVEAVHAREGDAAPVAASPRSRDTLRDEEEAIGITTDRFVAGYADRVHRQIEAIRGAVHRITRAHGPIAAYGAAAKGTVLLNTLGLTTDHIAWVADRNTHKHGLLMPGTHQPVVPTQHITERPPKALLVLAWNFAREIAGQQRDYLAAGGTLLVPLPELREITAEHVGPTD